MSEIGTTSLRYGAAGGHIIQPSRVWLLIAVFFVTLFSAESHILARPKVVVETTDSAGIEKLIKANKSLVLVAMAAWCAPCRDELPTLVKLHDKYSGRGLRMVGMSLDFGGPSAIKPVLVKAKVRFPVYWVGERAIGDYKIFAIPMLLLVRDGRVVERIVGRQPEAFLDRKIRDLLTK